MSAPGTSSGGPGAGDEVKLFDAPDLSTLQRNWPRIALRGSVLILVPVLVVWLARSMGLYQTISSLPLPLDSLRAGPFAYEAKVIYAIVAVLLGLAFLVPKRTPQLVIAVCVGAVLWTGHVFIQLQWARLFATEFNFRREATPDAPAWIFATLLLLVAVVYLLLENLIDTREQQMSRKLGAGETEGLLRIGASALGIMLGTGLVAALALVFAYLGLRALLAGATVPFRLNPVFVLFGMGVGLAILVALAARKRSPLAPGTGVQGPAVALPAPPPPPPLRNAYQVDAASYDEELRRRGL